MAWLLAAQRQTPNGGVPAFYDLLHDSWAPSYPETTGYIIPTLLVFAERHAHEASRRAALQMADYLLSVQTPEGAVRGWGAESPPFVFDTGQVLQGWLAAWQATGDQRFLAALTKAADWLATHQDPAGFWQAYQYQAQIKTWDNRVGWALLQAGQATGELRFTAAGRRCLDWALAQQAGDGWLDHCSLEPGQPPVTHTLAYAIEGFLESGALLADDRYIDAARLAADALLARQRRDGSLSAYWGPGWRPLSRSACLTGNAQMALCWLRLHELTGGPEYLPAGRRILAAVAACQRVDDPWRPIRGAIPGSRPLWGRYLRWRYPNWAAKFFLDALLLEQRLTEEAQP
ncbi:MAG: hypothetical protein IAE85_09540 [Anaerolinea sp.]|nr:hypothetical protein [Anaerolinea sp.]